MEPWLSRADLTQYIGTQEIPDSFRHEKLFATVQEVVEGWLSDLLQPAEQTLYSGLLTTHEGVFAAYTTYPEIAIDGLTAAQFTNSKLIRQFIAYAVWSVHVKKSNAISTDTGYVTKLNQDSDPITDRQRTELSLYYQGLAERKALEITRLIYPAGMCSPATGFSGRPVLRKAQPRSPSRLGN